MLDANSAVKFRTEKVAPEGAWGYLIAIGLMIPMSLVVGYMHSFGIIFDEFLGSVGAETGAVTTIMGTYSSSYSIAGMLASPLFKKTSMRSVGILGSILYFVGSVMTIFATSVEMLIISLGILQGAGIGLMVPVGYTSFNHYFVKKRVFAMSITSALKGIVIMLHPIISNILMNVYGFRGALAIIAAINANTIFGMLLMHPIKWHFKVIKVPERDEIKPLMDLGDDKFQNEIDGTIEQISDKHRKTSVGLLINAHENDLKQIRIAKDRSKSIADPTQIDDFKLIRRRIESIMSLNDLNGDAVTIKSSKSGIRQKIVDLFDLSLLKDRIYMNLVIGMSFSLFSDGTFLTILPIYLDRLGFSKGDITRIVSVDAGTDLVSRVLLALMSLFVQPKARYIFLAGGIATIIVRCVFIYTYSFNGMMVVIGLMGFFRTFFHVTPSLILGDHLAPDRFAIGYGFFMFLHGNLSFVIGPVIGWIRDFTHNYALFFHILTFAIALCVIPWIIEIFWTKICRKNNEK